jgi:hypothetical protein
VVSLAFGLALAPFGSAPAQGAFVGSWVLDTASSTAAPGLLPTGGTLEITAAGGGKYKSVSEVAMGGVNGRSEVTYAIDGKDYAATATPAQPGAPPVTQSIDRVSDTVYETSVKVGGQAIATALNEISSDGSTLTLTTTGLGQYAALSSIMVFRRK